MYKLQGISIQPKMLDPDPDEYGSKTLDPVMLQNLPKPEF